MMSCKQLASVLVSGVLLTGCTESLRSTPGAEPTRAGVGTSVNEAVFKRASGHDTSISEYIVDPPDEVQIKAPNIKEIDGVKQTVRADGKISLNLLGEIKVSGLTPAQVQKALQQTATKYYVNPDIKVEIVANSKFYQIFGRGAVTQGKKPYTGNDTVIKALAEAGPNENMWPQQVLLVRPERNGQPGARAVINFKRMIEDGDRSQNYVLEEGDIINLRDSPLASFNFKATQMLGPVSGGTEAGGSVRALGQR